MSQSPEYLANRHHVLQQATIFVLSLGLLAAACHPGLTPADANAAKALNIDAVVIRVNELQSVVIDYCGLAPDGQCLPGTIATPTAREVIKGLIDLRATLKAAPAGWQATVKAAWPRVKARLTGITNPAVLAAIGGVDAIVGGL